MSFFQWDASKYSVKVKEMDDEHIVLIEKMNKLHEAYERGDGYDILKALLNDFASYTLKHFEDEEEFMRKIRFSGYETHKMIHEKLIRQLKDHLSEFESKAELSNAFFSFLKVWLSSHIQGIDMKYGEEAIEKRAV